MLATELCSELVNGLRGHLEHGVGLQQFHESLEEPPNFETYLDPPLRSSATSAGVCPPFCSPARVATRRPSSAGFEILRVLKNGGGGLACLF